MVAEPTTYELDGSKINSLEDFYAVIGEAVNGPGGYFGSNLDALRDCLSGGFGTPPGPLRFVIHDARHFRVALGYEETVRQLEKRLARCHPSNRPSVRDQLHLARQRKGPTAHDWLLDIFDEAEEVALDLA